MQISLGLGIGIAVALALIVGVVTRFATISSLKNNADSKIGNAEAKAGEIIDDAVKTADPSGKRCSLLLQYGDRTGEQRYLCRTKGWR